MKIVLNQIDQCISCFYGLGFLKASLSVFRIKYALEKSDEPFMCKFVDRHGLLQSAVKVSTVETGRRKVPLFPFDHDRSDTVFEQCTEKVRTGIRKWHGAGTPFVKI